MPEGNTYVKENGKWKPTDFYMKTDKDRYFATEFYGDDTNSITFKVPFEPDEIVIMGWEPRSLLAGKKVVLFVCDIGSFGMGAGYFAIKSAAAGTTINNALMTSNSYLQRYSRDEEGNITVCFDPEKETNINFHGIFASDVKYNVVATKYSTKSTKERLTDFVNDLSTTESGKSVTVNKRMVNEAFTAQEWTDLIATRSNWTFTLF